MEEFEVINRESFKQILSATDKPGLSVDFTNSVMGQLETIRIKNRVYKKYMNRSLGLFILTVLLALTGIYVFATIEMAFRVATTSFIAHTFSVFIYMLISMLSGLIFYQFNNLLTYRFSELK